MKILIATGAYPPDIGGPATYSELLFNELPKNGVAADVLSFGSVRHSPKVIRHFQFFFKVLWQGRTADVIFSQDTVSVGLPALLASLVLGKIFVARVPGDYAWEQARQRFGVTDDVDVFQTKKYGFATEALRSIQKFVVGRADLAIAPSEYFAALVRGWVKDSTKVIRIYNGVDISSINLSKNSAGSFVPRTIVSAGRLVPWKGFDMLIKSLKDLNDWTLRIAGDGPDFDKLKVLAEMTGVADRVTFLGRLGKADLFKEIARADIFALNSAFETFSFQVVEAMALGTPTIAADIGNLREIIDTGRNGMLIEHDNTKQFVEAVRKISAEPKFRDMLSRGAIEKSKQFSIERTTSELTAAVSDLQADAASRKHKVFIAKMLRYLFSGGTAAVTNLALLYLLTDVAHVWYVISSVLAFVIAFVVSFFFQKFFTFQEQSKGDTHKQVFLYFLVAGINLMINTALIYVLVEFTGMNYLLGQISASIVIAIESYVVYGMFIFKK